MKNLLRLLAGLKVSVKTNPTLVRSTVVLNIHPDDISQKETETETELLLDDDTLTKAANYVSMVETAGKLGGVLHSVGSVGPKETANRLLKDDMDMDEKITAILYNVTSLHELVRKNRGLPPLGLYGSGKGKGNSNDGKDKGNGNGKCKGNGNGGNDKGKGNDNSNGDGGMFDSFDIHIEPF